MSVLESEELSYFVTYATIVLLKMVVLSPITGYYRKTRQVFANTEDMVRHTKEKKPVFDDEKVERVRRCHRNDLENIVPFFGLGLLYALFSGAAVPAVAWHFRVFTGARLFHTVAYLGAVPQPARSSAFAVGLVVNISMAVQLLMNNWNL